MEGGASTRQDKFSLSLSHTHTHTHTTAHSLSCTLTRARAPTHTHTHLSEEAEQLVGGGNLDVEAGEEGVDIASKLLPEPQAHLAPCDEQVDRTVVLFFLVHPQTVAQRAAEPEGRNVVERVVVRLSCRRTKGSSGVEGTDMAKLK